MKKLSVLLLLLLIFAFSDAASQPVQAQQPDSADVTKKALWLNAGQLIYQEVQLNYEHPLSRTKSLEFGLGYKFPTGSDRHYHHSSDLIAYYDNIARIHFSQGIFTSVSLKNYTSVRVTRKQNIARFYQTFGLFYRHWFYNNKNIVVRASTNDPGYNYRSVESLRQHVFGGKILWGYKAPLFNISPSQKLYIDIFAGLGLRYKFGKTTYSYYQRITFPETEGWTDYPTKERGLNKLLGVPFPYLTPQIGVRLGLNL